MKALADALAAARAGDFAATRDALIAAWRQRCSPAVAELVRLVDAKAPDALSAQIAALIAPRVATTLARFEALPSMDDPRISTWCIDALAQLPFTAESAQPLYLQLAERATGDPRLTGREEAIHAAVWTRINRLAVRQAIVARVRRAVEETPLLVDDPASTKLEQALAEVLAPLGRAARSTDALLAEIYANPEDDTARMVYADLLVELGDPRGEFIHLQLAGSNPERQTELLEQHGKSWLGRLAPVISHEPAWATVEEVWHHLPNILVEAAPLHALRKLAVSPESCAAIIRDARVFPAVRELRVTNLDLGIDSLHAAFPRLERIACVRKDIDPDDVARAAALGAREVVLSSHASTPVDLPARHELFAAAVAKLRGTPASVERVTLSGPFLTQTRPEVVVLQRGPDGVLASAP